MDNITIFPPKGESEQELLFRSPGDDRPLKDLQTWTWQDFRDAWQGLEAVSSEDTAWMMLYDIWRVRAGEGKTDE